MKPEDTTSHREMPLRQLEQSLIEEFVRARGYDPASLAGLPPETLIALMRDASVHASSRLTEIESRSHYLAEIHGVTPRVG